MNQPKVRMWAKFGLSLKSGKTPKYVLTDAWGWVEELKDLGCIRTHNMSQTTAARMLAEAGALYTAYTYMSQTTHPTQVYVPQ